MKRMFIAIGLAAVFAVGLAAQSTTGTAGSRRQEPQTGAQRGGGPRTITGCLRAGDTAGSYMLTNVEGLTGGRRGADATSGGSTATGGTATGGTATTAGTGGSTAATGGGTQGRMGAPMSIMLAADSSVDLKPHVGHKIEVTGTLPGGRGQGGGAAATTTGGGTATGGTATGGTATGGTATGTGSTAGGSATGGGQTTGARGMRTMTVTAIKMISDSCS